jgi:SAM-dependent methyltransferase
MAMTDEEYRETRRREWDAAGKNYGNVLGAALVDLMAQANAQIFKYAEIKAGDSVLDVGTGPGSPALDAAAFVGPTGKIVGVDFAPSMIQGAKRRAKDMGVANAEFFEMDAEAMSFADNSFDVIISRYGYPHFTNAVQALKESYRVLKPGGRLSAAMHGAVDRNPYFTGPLIALRPFQPTPMVVTDRGPFFFHETHLLEAAMKQAGFKDFRVFTVDTTIRIENFDKYLEAQKAGGAAVRRAVALVPEARRAEAEEAAWNALQKYVTGNTGVLPAQYMMGVGTKS